MTLGSVTAQVLPSFGPLQMSIAGDVVNLVEGSVELLQSCASLVDFAVQMVQQASNATCRSFGYYECCPFEGRCPAFHSAGGFAADSFAGMALRPAGSDVPQLSFWCRERLKSAGTRPDCWSCLELPS